MSLPRYIPNNLLRADKLPPQNATWGEIGRFALTFDGYKHCGGFEPLAELARARRSDTLSDLRACLFFEQRRWRHYGQAPEGEDLRYVRDVLEEIRSRVQAANALLA